MTDNTKTRVLLIFVDGLGVGPRNPAVNPFAAVDCRVLKIVEGDSGRLPYDGWFKPIDASLGMPGLPQSATGQTTILTGINAAEARGGHLNGFPDEGLKMVIAENNIMKQAVKAGMKVTFADAYRPGFFKYGHLVPHSVTTVAALDAGLKLRTLEDLRKGKAVYHEFTNRILLERGEDVPLWTPEQAAVALAGLVSEHDFTLYESFQSDRAGHAMDRECALQVIRELDEFVDALLGKLNLSETLVVMTSDHGNVEDLSQPDHTTHPVPLLAWGVGAGELAGKAMSLPDVTPFIREILQLPE